MLSLLPRLLAAVRPHCVDSSVTLLLWLAGDTGMLLAYLWIPRSLRAIARGIPEDAKGRREILGTASFVQACGVTHLFRNVVLFFPSWDWAALLWLAYAVSISFAVAHRLDAMRAELTGALSGYRRLERFVRRG